MFKKLILLAFKNYLYIFIKYSNIDVISWDVIPEAVNSPPSNRKTRLPRRSANFIFWDLPCAAWGAVGALVSLTGWEGWGVVEGEIYVWHEMKLKSTKSGNRPIQNSAESQK